MKFFKLYWSSAVICKIKFTWNIMLLVFIWMFPFSVTGWVTKAGKLLLSFFMYFKTTFESVQKKIHLTFSLISSIDFFFIRTAATAACNSSFGIDNVFSFKGASLLFPIKNVTFTKFSSVIFRKYTTHTKTWLEKSENKCTSVVPLTELKP